MLNLKKILLLFISLLFSNAIHSAETEEISLMSSKERHQIWKVLVDKNNTLQELINRFNLQLNAQNITPVKLKKGRDTLDLSKTIEQAGLWGYKDSLEIIPEPFDVTINARIIRQIEGFTIFKGSFLVSTDYLRSYRSLKNDITAGVEVSARLTFNPYSIQLFHGDKEIEDVDFVYQINNLTQNPVINVIFKNANLTV